MCARTRVCWQTTRKQDVGPTCLARSVTVVGNDIEITAGQSCITLSMIIKTLQHAHSHRV